MKRKDKFVSRSGPEEMIQEESKSNQLLLLRR